MEELQSGDPKVIKKIEKNIDFIVACMAVKPEKKDKKDKEKKEKKKSEPEGDLEAGGSPRLGDSSHDRNECAESSHKLKDREERRMSSNEASKMDVSSKLEQDFNTTMRDINNELVNVRAAAETGLRRRKGDHPTSTYEEDAQENDLQRLSKRWNYLAAN